MNRKGDVPTILLFFVLLALAGIALFSFAGFSERFASDSEGRSRMLSDIAFYEQYLDKKIEMIGKEAIGKGGSKEEFQELARKNDLRIEGMNNFYDKIARGEFKFEKKGNKYEFEIINLKLRASAGANYIERGLNINRDLA